MRGKNTEQFKLTKSFLGEVENLNHYYNCMKNQLSEKELKVQLPFSLQELKV